MKIALWFIAAALCVAFTTPADRGFVIGCGIAIVLVAAISWSRARADT